MANITARLLTIAGNDISHISEYTVEYNKLWKDADRNMLGEVRASLIGIFPKIKVKTTVQQLNEIMSLGDLLNVPYFSVTYFDIVAGTTRTANYYASDFATKLRRRDGSLIDECSFNLVPVSRRT